MAIPFFSTKRPATRRRGAGDPGGSGGVNGRAHARPRWHDSNVLGRKSKADDRLAHVRTLDQDDRPLRASAGTRDAKAAAAPSR